MSFFNKIFGFGSHNDVNELVFPKNHNPKTWPAMFTALVIAESTSTPPSHEDVKGVIEDLFPSLLSTEISDIFNSVLAMHNYAKNQESEWKIIWANFLGLLKDMMLSDNFTNVRSVASVAFKFKMLVGMEEMAESYVYWLSKMEDYMQISKSDFKLILEEEKENTGYNDYNQN